MIPSATTVALAVSGVALAFATAALLIILLRHPRPTDTPLEGLDDLATSIRRDLPTAEVHRPYAGTVYAGIHRRAGTGRWVADLGRPHPRGISDQDGDLPRLR